MTSSGMHRLLVCGLLTAGVLLAGCGSSGERQVLAPSVDSPDSEQLSGAAPDSIGGDASSGLIGGLGDLLGGVLQGVVKIVSGLVNGLTGGRVENGRYAVRFQPGAFQGSQLITITDLGRQTGEVVLTPHGLNFSNTVELEINLSGTAFDSPHPTIMWLDPSTGNWVDMHGTYDPTTHRVKAVLPHFSTYRPRAGW